MRIILALIGCVVSLSGALLQADEKSKAIKITFAKADDGKLPSGWTAAKTGAGEGSVWKVVADATTPSKSGYALAQTAEGPKPLFSLCIKDDSRFLDGEISVRLKSVDGKIDQGGGICWRVQDAKNYYIARYNPLEANFRVYKVIDGVRSQLASADVTIKDDWHTLTIKHAGEKIECLLENKLLLEAKDTAIKVAGKVGLWTKADAQTRFDELIISGR